MCGRGGDGSLIFSYISGLCQFLGFKILNFQYLWEFSGKMNIWGGGGGGMKMFCIFFEGHHKIRLVLGVISMHFRVFS